MIATINTATKTITLESSFKHPEWVEFFNNLPEEWQSFTFGVGTGKQDWLPRSGATIIPYNSGGTVNPYDITYTFTEGE